MPRILCVMGQIASGKGSVAAHLAKRHFARIESFSGYLREEWKRQGVETPTREQYTELAMQQHRELGPEHLARVFLERVKEDPADSIVVADSPRWPEHLRYLRDEAPHVRFWYVDADDRVRWHRSRLRAREPSDANMSFEDFMAMCAWPTERQIPHLRRMCHAVIENSRDDLAGLHGVVDALVVRWR